MKITSLAIALAVPAAVVVAAEPADSTATPAAELKSQITAQARMEMSMLTMQYPTPTDRSNPMAQISYIFELCHAANQALIQTAQGITDKDSADKAAIELGARRDVYLGLCIAAAFSGLSADQLPEEDQQKITEFSANQNKEDRIMSAELRRLEENDFYGSEQLKAVMKLLSADTPQVKVEEEDEAAPAEGAPAEATGSSGCAELETLIAEQAKREKEQLLADNPQETPANDLEKVENFFKLFQAANLALLDTAKGITDKETAEAKALELGGRCQVYIEMGYASEELSLRTPLSDEDRAQLKLLFISQREIDKETATELKRLKDNDFYGSDYLKAVFDVFRRNVKR